MSTNSENNIFQEKCSESHIESIESSDESTLLKGLSSQQNNNLLCKIKHGDSYFEYESQNEPSMDYQRFDDDKKKDDWKKARPTFLESLWRCFKCSFCTTLLCGIPGGLLAVILTWLDLNLAESCYSYNTHWYEMPTNVRRIRLTAQVVEGMVIQFWSFTSILFVFGWKSVHDMNIPIWNVLAAALDAIYRLLLSLYGVYNRKWASYPLNILFASISCFNFYRITIYFETKTFSRFKLALKFGIAFLLGIPLFLTMNYLLLPVYSQAKSDIKKAVFSSLLPVAFIIPKAIINVCLTDVSKYCIPGRLSVFIVGFHTITTIVARYLQANVETRAIFIAISFVHAFENLIDKLTYNLRNKLYRYFFGSCVGKDDEEREIKQLTLNRIQADQTLASMILETDTIFMSCALVEILNYYYGKKIESNYKIWMRFVERVSIAAFIDLVFNTLCVKVQTWYFNIPVMRVWRKKWLWVFAFIVIYTCYTMLYCSEYLYGAVITHDSFNSTEIAECLRPFEKPHG